MLKIFKFAEIHGIHNTLARMGAPNFSLTLSLAMGNIGKVLVSKTFPFITSSPLSSADLKKYLLYPLDKIGIGNIRDAPKTQYLISL